MTRALIALFTLLALSFGLAACAAQETWHPVTAEESERLAISRFNNFDEGVRQFNTSVTVQGSELELHGWYDFVEHIGYAAVTGRGFEPQAITWSEQAVMLREQQPDDVDSLPQLPIPPPAEANWQLRALDPTSSPLDTLLISFAHFASDRPDNPLLLVQSGALWLASESLETETGVTPVEVFAGPPSDAVLGPDDPTPTPESARVKYWLDENALMLRVELLIGSQWVAIDFTNSSDTDLASPRELLSDLIVEVTG